MTGHGGDEFLKFQDNEEVSAFDIGDAIGQMWEKKRWVSDRAHDETLANWEQRHRYNRMLFMVDTCQANTLYNQIYSPNVLMTGSSALGENSYSVSRSSRRLNMATDTRCQHHNDPDIGVSVIDSFTHYILQYLEGLESDSQATLQEFVSQVAIVWIFRNTNALPFPHAPAVRHARSRHDQVASRPSAGPLSLSPQRDTGHRLFRRRVAGGDYRRRCCEALDGIPRTVRGRLESASTERSSKPRYCRA